VLLEFCNCCENRLSDGLDLVVCRYDYGKLHWIALAIAASFSTTH
jgi:hypothetical protein